jgi:hypothetical protein
MAAARGWPHVKQVSALSSFCELQTVQIIGARNLRRASSRRRRWPSEVSWRRIRRVSALRKQGGGRKRGARFGSRRRLGTGRRQQMGLETRCQVRFGGRAVSGRAQLETQELLFRGGDLKLRIPFGDVKAVTARAGTLDVSFGGGRASFALGPAAETWARKIRNPRGLMDKLGVKPGLRVSVLGLAQPDLLRQLCERTTDVSERKPSKDSDLIFFGIAAKPDLARLARLRGSLKSNGGIWAVWTKGQKALTENDVRAAALAAGLVDVKVVSVSDTLSGLKLVIPRAKR